MKVKQWVAVAMLVAAAGVVQARKAPLIDPEPVKLPVMEGQVRNTEAVRAAIVAGSADIGWTVLEDVPGKLTLRYVKQNKHEVVVAARYDANGYQLTYVSSVNMNYADGAGMREIHPNYARWIENLQRKINAAAYR